MDLHTPNEGIHIASGKDRHSADSALIWGLFPLSIKVATRDTGGALFVFEHRDMPKGGPPRHVHHGQDEWFYAIKGDFRFEIGEEAFLLKPGDSLFAPRKVPHAWAHIGNVPGTLLIAMSPAGSFETFIRDTTKLRTLPTPEEIAKAFAAHDMTVVGPPLGVE
jgi:mannose-6-phosphate isomerase-like protein (cupin superfamily)